MSWLQKLGLQGPGRGNREGLSRDWNARGRAHFETLSARFTAYYAEDRKPFDTVNDPREITIAEAVLKEVIKLNEQGDWQAARRLFDPAHEPFIPMLRERGQALACVTILGPDACLVRLGSSYQEGDTQHIVGDKITRRADIWASSASRNHDWLLLVLTDGFHVRRGLTEPDHAVLPWPCTPQRLDRVCLSDDGRRIAFADDDLGIWIGDTGLGNWQIVYPTAQDIADMKIEMDDEDYEWSGSMVNCDLSPDGRYLAYGTQSDGHWLARIDDNLAAQEWAHVNPNIDYPHNACFSGDSRYVALNGCHFYNGETLVVDVAASQGLAKTDYNPDPRTPFIEDILRVYANTWLPPEATGLDTGAFVLAGLGYMTAVTPAGEVLFSQYFGSSASSIDYCPRTRRLFLGSFSGFLHVYDIDREATAEQTYGYRPRHELCRWVFWKDYQPFRW